MAIDLYSKATLDTLLAAKLSDAPSDGSTYGRKDGAWEIVAGGSYLPLSGGTLTGTMDVTDGTNTATAAAQYVKVIDGAGRFSKMESTVLTVSNGAGGQTVVGATSITFSDSTIQTTAWTGVVPGPSINQVSSGPYTLVASDANNIVRCSGFGTSDYVYLPDDATAAIPVGSRITILADGTNNLGVTSSGSASLLWDYGSPLYINNTNGGTAVKVAADTWFLVRP